MKISYQLVRPKLYEIISCLVLIVYFLPFFTDSSSVKYLVHDLLNDKVVYYKNLADSGLLFAGNNAVYEHSMGGFPRGYLLTEFSVVKWLYLIFSAQWAVNINYILIHCIAFIGMRAFLKAYVTNRTEIYNMVALAFAMLPTLPYLGIGVLGIPLLLYAMLNLILGKGGFVDGVIIFLFPVYSMFAMTNMYTFPVFGLIYLFGLWQGFWRFQWRTILPFILLFVSTLIVEYRLILLSLSGVPNNRMIYFPDESAFLNWKGIAGGTIKAFFLGHYHFHSLSLYVSVISVVIVSVILFLRQRLTMVLKSIIPLIAMLSFLSVFLNNYNLKLIFGEKYPFIDYRFWALLPAFWYMAYASAVSFIIDKTGIVFGRIVLIIGVVFVMFMLYPKDFRGSRYADNVFANTWIYPDHPEQATFNDYYKPEVFNEIIRSVPDITSVRVACIGVVPEVAQFNGLRTIDGYYSLYPAENWYFNRKVDSLERMKTKYEARNYTNLNNLYVAEEGRTTLPDWNYSLLKKTGVKYLISDRQIDTGNLLRISYKNALSVYYIK